MERRSGVSRARHTRLGEPNHPAWRSTDTFPDSSDLKTKEPAAHGLASSKRHGLSSGFQNGSSRRHFRKWRLRKAERLARLGAAVGTLLGGLGGSGCPPPQPIPGRAASLPLPANSLDGIPRPRRADRAARTPLSLLVGLRVATATATSGSGGSAKSARPVRGRVREPLPDSLLGRTCCQGRGGRPGSPRTVASPASGSALEPWAPTPRPQTAFLCCSWQQPLPGAGAVFPPVPLPAPRLCFSVAPGNSHFRERVQFPLVPPPRPSTASARTQGSGLPATVSRRSSLSAGGGG